MRKSSKEKCENQNQNLAGRLRLKVTEIRVIRLVRQFVVLAMGILLGFFLAHYDSWYPVEQEAQMECYRGSSLAPLRDEELVWRASMVPLIREFPFKRVPKIAFMFLVKDDLPLAPLWEAFFKPHDPKLYSLYVHQDASFHPLNGVFRRTRVPSQQVIWGKFSMIEAEIRLLSNALLDSSNERFVLLSESCIPLFNFQTIYRYLLNSSTSFVESYDLAGRVGRGRYNHHMNPNITLHDWRKGSQWFEMDRALALDVISDRSYFSVFKRTCNNRSCYADEHYFPTLVNKRFGGRNSNRSVTWADWSHGGSHPARYTNSRVTPELLSRMRSAHQCWYNMRTTTTCFLFARKFLPHSLDTLMSFAPKLFQF